MNEDSDEEEVPKGGLQVNNNNGSGDLKDSNQAGETDEDFVDGD